MLTTFHCVLYTCCNTVEHSVCVCSLLSQITGVDGSTADVVGPRDSQEGSPSNALYQCVLEECRKRDYLQPILPCRWWLGIMYTHHTHVQYARTHTTHMHACTHALMCTCTHAYMHTHHTHACIHARTHAHTRTHAYTHTHAHTHTHTRARARTHTLCRVILVSFLDLLPPTIFISLSKTNFHSLHSCDTYVYVKWSLSVNQSNRVLRTVPSSQQM